MFCPRCATQNIDNARFCRSCGAHLSLVPQALSGRLPEDQSAKVERIKGAMKRRREPNLGRGIRRTSIGFAFLVIVAALFFTRGSPGPGEIWLLLPAFLLLGKGISEIITVTATERAARQLDAPPAALHTNQLLPHSTYDPIAPPPSVTEDTTRHLEADQQNSSKTT